MTVQQITSPYPPAYETRPLWVDLMAPAARLAEAIARTEFVPKGMRGNPSAIAAAILLGQELGLGPMTALNNLDVVEGSVHPSAELMRALVLRAGHELNVVESTNARCVLAGRRRGSQEWTTVTWSIDDAQRAGLAGRGPWKSYPRVMLQARATTELSRLIFADVVSGLPAENDAPDSETGDAPTPAKPARMLKRRQAEEIEAPKQAPTEGVGDTPADGSVETAGVPASDHASPRTEAQSRKIFALLKQLGWDKRDDALNLISAIVGRAVPSSSLLTKPDAHLIIEFLSEAQTQSTDERDLLLTQRVVAWQSAAADINTSLDDAGDDERGE